MLKKDFEIFTALLLASPGSAAAQDEFAWDGVALALSREPGLLLGISAFLF